MESEEKRRPQASEHDGVVCHKCGWVYPNPHPSAKQRRAHRRHCGRAASAAVSTAGGGAGGGEGKKASDEELSDEDRHKNSELVVSDLNLGFEEENEVKGCVGSGGEVGNGKDAILETNNADNTLEQYVLLHCIQVHGPGMECSASPLESDNHFENHALSCNADLSCSVNMDSATKPTESSDCVVLTKAFMVASEEKQEFSSAQCNVNSAMIVNDTNVVNYAKKDINGDMPVSPTVLGNPASDSSVIDSQLQKMDEYVEINIPLHNATVSTPMKVFPADVSANTEEPKSNACRHAQDEQTDGGGQLSQNESLSKGGSCLMENNDREYLDASAHSDQPEYQNGKPEIWKVNGNELENLSALQMPSNTPPGEIFKVKSRFCKDHGSVEPNLTVISAGAEAGNELNYHLEDESPEIVPLFKLDKVANDIPSTKQIHESNPPYKEAVGINAFDGQNDDDQSRKDEHVNGDRSTLVNDFDLEAGLSLAKSEDSEGLGSHGFETQPCFTITGTSGSQTVTLDDQVTGSHETCVALNQLEGFETEFQYEEHSYRPSTDLFLHDHMVVTEVSALAASDWSQVNERTKITNEIQLVIDEATKVSNHCGAGELQQEICEDESCHLTKTNPQPKYNTLESEPLPDEYIEEKEREKSKDLSASTCFDDVSGFEHNENNSTHPENGTEDQSDQLEHKKFIQIRFTENTVGDSTNDTDMRMNLQDEHTNTVSSLLEELHDELDEHKIQTEHEEYISGSQLVSQNGFQDDAAVGDNTNNPDARTRLQNEHMNTVRSLLEELHNELDDHKIHNAHRENISGSQLGPQNGFQDDSMDPSVGDDSNCTIQETAVWIPPIQTENGVAKLSSEEPDSEESCVCLCIHSAQDFTLEGHITSTSVESESIENPITCNDPEIVCKSGVASGVCFQPLKEEHIHNEAKQQSNISSDSNGQTDSVEELQGSVPVVATDGMVPSIRHNTDGIPMLDPQILLPANAQTPKDLCASKVAQDGALPESSDVDGFGFEEPSCMSQVQPGRRSVSHEIQSIRNSQDEYEARKKNEEINAKVVRGNSGKVHIPLKTLLAEANFENQQLTKAQEHDTSLQDKNRLASQDERCTAKAWRSKIASERPAESSLSQADYKEWNSPARLPVTRNQKKRVKGKQPWVPFICCPSIN